MPKWQAKPQRRARSQAELQRSGASRTPRSLILIVCEGEKTEYHYFNGLRKSGELLTVTIVVMPTGRQAEQLVALAVQARAQRRRERDALPYDEVWCVFDREAHYEPRGFAEAIRRAKRENLHLAISNPCFEYWYLLHFRETNTSFADANAVEVALRHRNCLPNYEKHLDLFTQLRPRMEQAIERAERLYNCHPDHEHDRFPNPSTLVQRLVRRLLEA